MTIAKQKSKSSLSVKFRKRTVT